MVKNKSAIKYVLSLAAMLFSTFVSAATLTFDGDMISGVSGLETLGTTWDVTFNDGSADAVYGTNPPFSTVSDSQTASEALRLALVALAADATASDFVGCAGTDCYLISPYAINEFTVAGNAVAKIGTSVYYLASVSGDPSLSYSDRTYATWEESVVPIPAAIWLFGSGLIGLIGIARRKKA